MNTAAQRRRQRQLRRDDGPPPAEDLGGRIIDQAYRITKVIGQGGMSTIYEAESLSLRRVVALKVLHPTLSDDPEAVARLKREAQIVSAIGHPNICAVLDIGRTENGSPYLVMERLIGETLAERIGRHGPMTFAELAPVIKQVLAALAAAHNRGIVHRDLKPENVFVEQRRAGRPVLAKLLDFGISKPMGDGPDQESHRLTHTGMVMGTPYYMAPEQARGDAGLDQRVDLWAVGVIMYEALSGRRPFEASNYNALLVKILTSKPIPLLTFAPDLSGGVVALVDKALCKLREDRFQTASEFLDELTEVQCRDTASDLTAPTLVMRRGPKSTRTPAVGTRAPWAEHIDWANDYSQAHLGDEQPLAAGAHDTEINVPPAKDSMHDTEVMRRSAVIAQYQPDSEPPPPTLRDGGGTVQHQPDAEPPTRRNGAGDPYSPWDPQPVRPAARRRVLAPPRPGLKARSPSHLPSPPALVPRAAPGKAPPEAPLAVGPAYQAAREPLPSEGDTEVMVREDILPVLERRAAGEGQTGSEWHEALRPPRVGVRPPQLDDEEQTLVRPAPREGAGVRNQVRQRPGRDKE